MTKRRFCFTFFLLICFSLPLTATAQTVNIPDDNLRDAIWNELGYLPDDSPTIPVSDMAKLTELTARNRNITDLTGLQAATNLEVLNLGTALVAGVLVNSNSISDIARLAELPNLTDLDLESNSISDIAPLAGLTNLTALNLRDNSISDVSPLIANTGLGSGDTVDVSENPLNHASINTHIPALQSRGVTVDFSVNIPDDNLRDAIWNELGYFPNDSPIPTSDMVGLAVLRASRSNITDLTGLEYATNLTVLELGGNSITDISAVAELTNLRRLNLSRNSITDISAVAGLPNLTRLNLEYNSIADISPLTANAGLGQGAYVDVIANPLNHASITVHIPALRRRGVEIYWFDNIVAQPTNILDSNLRVAIENALGVASGATIVEPEMAILTVLEAPNANITDLTGLEHATNLTELNLADNSISDISPLATLNDLTDLGLRDNSISDLSPLVANTGLGTGDMVDVSENPLNDASINTHIPALQSRGVEVHAENLKPTTSEYTLTIPAGISLIHVPLKVTAVNGSPKTIESISELYDVLGGAGAVNFLITYDSQTQEWRSYFGPSDKGAPADRVLTDDMGIIAGMTFPRTTHFSGNPLGTDGTSTIILNQGLNVVGLPLNDSRINRVSNLFTLDGIGGNVPVIILTDGGEFKAVGRAGDPGDIEITGGQAFIMTASRAAMATISGDAWANGSGTSAAPPVTLKGIKVGDTTPVLGLRGTVIDEGTGLNNAGFRVTVKNLSTGRAVVAITAPDEAGYRSTVVDIETGRAATVGDILEISAQSPNPFVGVDPLRYTVTAEDVKQSLIQLPELVAYEIPAETQLLHNYPNPFNPETWIPYRLAEDAFVTLTIYDQSGQVVRTIEVGHQTAAVYENRSKAIYWDGRNGLGEQVASGVYFYHLSAGDYSATQKMLILK